MATYDELRTAAENGQLRNRVVVACFVAADKIRLEAGATANHANRLKWAKVVYGDPQTAGDKMLWAVLAANRAATLSQIVNADDAAIQTAVDTAVDVFADGAA